MADIPLLTPFPAPPSPEMAEAVFDEHAGNTLLAEKDFVDEMNASVIPGINQAVLDASSAIGAAEDARDAAEGYASAANDSKIAAQQAAEDATENGAEQVDLAAQQVGLATVQANNAAASAAAAEAAGGTKNLAFLHAVTLSF